jgi:hypothetical protein
LCQANDIPAQLTSSAALPSPLPIFLAVATMQRDLGRRSPLGTVKA